MQFAIDIGNTLIKIATFEGKELRKREEFSTLEELITLLPSNFSTFTSIISSVKHIQPYPIFDNSVRLNHQTALPFVNQYLTPETLGMDRVAAMAGAWELFPNENVLVIDIGTCITYDILNESGEYEGGMISPGLEMRLKAMNQFTSSLPLVSRNNGAEKIGKSTTTCLQAGAKFGVEAEIEGLISLFKEDYPDLKTIICGGGGKLFERRKQSSIFVLPNLVLLGLNCILLYNEFKKKS
jgi:type III pantothenate kinase